MTVAGRYEIFEQIGVALEHPDIVAGCEWFDHGAAPFLAARYVERRSPRRFAAALQTPEVVGAVPDLLSALEHERGRDDGVAGARAAAAPTRDA